MITKITFEEIYPIWKYELWPDRESPIEPNSAMQFMGGYDMYNMTTIPTFFAFKIENIIAGVNSGHMCAGNVYRSRGIYVYDRFRGREIGVQLLLATIEQGKLEGASFTWSYPRKSSWQTYTKAGFHLMGDWEKSETSDNNAYARTI